MEQVKSLLESLWENLFILFPSEITVFLISVIGVVLGLAVYRMVVGG